MNNEGTYAIDVLAVAPHPDDVEIFCGGVVLTLADRGHRTGILDLTRGELASQGTVDERAREAQAASAVLGLSLRENLGLPDGFIDPWPGSPHVAPAVAALRRLRPELLLLPWNQERHPDHVAASELMTRAVFFANLKTFDAPGGGAPFAPRQVLYYEMRHRMPASFIVDTSAAWERKARAIACHQSQVTRRDDAAVTLISSELALSAIEARDRYRGSEIGVRYGEALKGPQALALPDPLSFFRSHPQAPAHAFEDPR
jgi:bacillithiol biosynthesis deacetylase BshB1